MCDKMVKMFYIVTTATILVLITLFCCIVESFKKKTLNSRSLGYFEIVCFCSMLFCFLIYGMPNKILSRLMLGFYCLSLDFSLYFLAYFVLSFEDSADDDNILIKYGKYLFLFFTAIDAIFLLSSSVTGMCFDVLPFEPAPGISSWIMDFKVGIIFHLGLYYTISIYIFTTIIKQMAQFPSFYRTRFLVVLILFLVEFTTNLMYITNPKFWYYDFSSIVYGIMTIICFSITSYSIPVIIKKRIVEIASNSISDAILCFDHNGKNFYINEAAKIYSNADNDEWVHKILATDSDYLLKTVYVDVDGEKRTCKVEFRRFADKKHRAIGSYIKLRDYTQEVEKIKQEEYRASHDALTGLLNRDFFFREAQRVLSNDPNVPRVIVCTNIKHFKMFNEMFGSKQGDSILITQANMMRKADYDNTVIGRISSDKFAMLIRERDYNPELALKNTGKIKEITKTFDFPLTVYIGVYKIEDPKENVRSMYDKAYMAIKNIKEGSNTTLSYYNPIMLDKLMEEKNIVSRFESALNNNQFIFYLQSQIDSKTKKCVGAEALTRWNFPGKGIIQPSEFIPTLEQSGLIYKLDNYIWEESAKLLKRWKDMGVDKYISVNISVKDFYYLDIYKVFTELVEKYEIEPSKLNLEITESVVSGNNQNHKDMLKKLQEYGFKIEMDDFGSGYSSLNLLKDVSMDVLKIDMGFLTKTENSERAEVIINSIAKMAKKLGMTIIAEGLEIEKQSEYLEKINVDFFQGFLYSEPISVEDFESKYLEVK